MLGHGPVAGAAHLQPRFANPRDVPNLKLWLRGDMGVTLNGATVSTWADQSGSGNNFSQGTAAAQPTFRSSGINGHADLDFNGVDHFLTGPAISSIFGASAKSLFVVISIDTFGATESIMAEDGTFLLVQVDTSGGNSVRVRNYDVDSDVVSLAASADTKYILHMDHNGSRVLLRLNDTEGTVLSGATNDMSASSRIGTIQGKYDGKIAEVVAYNRAISASERSLILDYLKARYSIA